MLSYILCFDIRALNGLRSLYIFIGFATVLALCILFMLPRAVRRFKREYETECVPAIFKGKKIFAYVVISLFVGGFAGHGLCSLLTVHVSSINKLITTPLRGRANEGFHPDAGAIHSARTNPSRSKSGK